MVVCKPYFDNTFSEVIKKMNYNSTNTNLSED